MATGVYCWRNTVNGKVYVGSSSTSIRRRMLAHKRQLNGNKHYNARFQAAWNEHGAESFEFSILEECKPVDCLDREQYWIDKFRAATEEHGYNICVCSHGPYGEEDRKRVSDGQKRAWAKDSGERSAKLAARNRSIENRRKVAATLTGHGFSEETKAKIAASLRGKKLNAQQYAAVVASIMRRTKGRQNKNQQLLFV
jgi:group I intron endonuclease